MRLNLSNRHYLLVISTIALVHFLSAQLAFLVFKLNSAKPSPVWFPAGIALAALLLWGRRMWAGVAVGAFAFARSLGVSLEVAGLATLGSTSAAVFGEWLLSQIQIQTSLKSLRDVLGFIIVGVVLSPSVNATVSTLNAGLSGLQPWREFSIHWWTIWLGDSMGVLVVTPLLLTWLGRPLPAHLAPRAILQQLQHSVSYRRQAIEVVVGTTLLLSVSWVVFQSTPKTELSHYPLEYLPFPFIIWAALRLGQRGMVLSSLAISTIAVWGAVQHGGPFLAKTNGDVGQAVLLLQAFVGVITITALLLAAVVAERQQVEDRLRESEKRFRGMFEAAAIGIGLDDLRGHIVESNPALQSMLGYSREELDGMNFAEFTHPEDLATDVELFGEMIVGKRDFYQIEKRHVRKDREVVWVRLTNSLVRDEVGEPKFTIGMVENITERKRAEEALQQSEARFRTVAETAACAFLVYQGNHLRYVNPATEVITEYSRDELLEMNFWDLAHPDFRDLVRQRGLARQQGQLVPTRYEIKIVTKSGRERWVDFNAGTVWFEGNPAALATACDITDRKQAEVQLRQAAEREHLLAEISLRIRRSLNLQEILDTTVAEVRHFLKADRVFISRFNGTGGCRPVAESVDPGWASILDWVSDTAPVEEIRALFTDGRVRVVNDIEQIEQPPFLSEYYERCQVRAGIGVALILEGQMFGVLIANQCSGPRQWQPFEIDLLEKLATQVEIAIQQGQLYSQVQALANNLERQVESRTAELHQRMRELQSLNQVKDLLLHAVSHDLRTPVQGMLMVLNGLRGKCEEAVALSRPKLDLMIQSCDRQLQLLNSLRENHCTDPTQILLNYRSTSLSEVLQLSLKTMEPLLTDNQAILINQISEDLPLIKADPTQLQQVYTNLLTNAVKHNPPGTTITLSTLVLESASTNPASEPQPPLPQASVPMVYCTVEDNGVGMSPDQCDRLFQLYVRGVDNRHLTGIGLGLHHCQQIIAAHGGQIGILSQPGVGSKFWFTLPLAREADVTTSGCSPTVNH